MSQSLYKYLPYKCGSLKILSDATLKFTHPSDFNDPFDCFPKIEISDLSEVERLNPEKYYELLNSGFSMDSLNLAIKELHEQKQLVDVMFRDLRVLCLSSVSDEILMWSHYSENHQGFVCEFEVPDIDKSRYYLPAVKGSVHEFFAYHLQAKKVDYSGERPNLNFPKYFDRLEDMLLKKSASWRYENEFRVFDYSGTDGARAFKPELLKTVIFGARMKETHKLELTKLVDYFNEQHQTQVTLKQAKLAKNTYQIEIEDMVNP